MEIEIVEEEREEEGKVEEEREMLRMREEGKRTSRGRREERKVKDDERKVRPSRKWSIQGVEEIKEGARGKGQEQISKREAQVEGDEKGKERKDV